MSDKTVGVFWMLSLTGEELIVLDHLLPIISKAFARMFPGHVGEPCLKDIEEKVHNLKISAYEMYESMKEEGGEVGVSGGGVWEKKGDGYHGNPET